MDYVGTAPSAVRRAARGASFQCPETMALILRADFSAIPPIQQIPHRLPSRLIRFRQRLALVSAHPLLFSGSIRLRFAACRTSVGKPRLPRLQLKFLRADHTNFNRKCHLANYFINHPETHHSFLKTIDLPLAAASRAVQNQFLVMPPFPKLRHPAPQINDLTRPPENPFLQPTCCG